MEWWMIPAVVALSAVAGVVSALPALLVHHVTSRREARDDARRRAAYIVAVAREGEFERWVARWARAGKPYKGRAAYECWRAFQEYQERVTRGRGW